MSNLNINTVDNQITITPTATEIRVFSGGYSQPGGANTEVQYNNGGVLAGAANITYTNGNMLISNNNFKITGGINGYFLQTDGSGNLTWSLATSGGSGVVGGANTQIQFNNAGNFGGIVGLTVNPVNNNVSMPNNLAVVSNVSANYFIGNGSQLTGIDASKIQNGNSNVSVASNSNITFGVAGNANVVTVTGNGIELGNGLGGTISGANLISANIISATGNVTANYFIGNGSQLTGIDASQISNGNSNVRVFANSDVTISIGGVANVLVINTSNNISATGNITATRFIGNGATLTNLTGANVTGTVPSANVANLVNISNGNASSASTFYPVFTGSTGNGVLELDNFGSTITYTPNISRLTFGIARVERVEQGNAAIDFDSTNNRIRMSVTGLANGLVLSNSVVTVNTVMSVSGNATIGNVGNTRSLDVFGTVGASGNIFAGNFTTQAGNIIAYTGYVQANGGLFTIGNANIGQNSIIGGNLTVLGVIIGNGASITELNASNLSTGTVPSARMSGNYSINISGSASTITTNAQPNITSVGTLSNLSVTGNVSANNFIGNLIGAFANGTSNVAIPTANGNVVITSNAIVGLTISSNVVKFGNGIAGNINNVNYITANSVQSNVFIKTGVYANTTTRDSAIPTPAAGMIVLVSNVGGSAKFQGYDGTTWANLN